ncbi:MAG: DUF58 domain-containing protein [Actinomycetota bacterium]|nr:DUF58 domain-containing protein [Actinomycetota bacterium]
MIRHPSPKLGGYASLAAAFLAGALALGRPELVALAAPFALVLVAGLATSREPTWSQLSISIDRDRLVEGETVSMQIEIIATRDVERLEVLVPVPLGLVVDEEASLRAIRLLAGERRSLALRLRCERWGVYELGEILLRAYDRLDLFRFDDRHDARRSIKVYPRAEALRALVHPAQTQLHFGNQVARHSGEGVEFSELRPFVPGDRVRSIDWKVTARKGSPWVRERHPERNTDVVIFLDTFSDVSTGGRSSTLERAVRAAATVADAYLRRRDRVAVVSFGGVLRWLEPAMGARQLYRIVDALLGTEIAVSYAWKGIEVIPVRTLPPRALVLAVTPLLDERSVAAIFDLRGRGFDVAVIDVSPVPPAPTQADPIANLARRVWLMERQVLRRRLQRIGVAVSEWREDEFLQQPVWEVEAFRRSARLVNA